MATPMFRSGSPLHVGGTPAMHPYCCCYYYSMVCGECWALPERWVVDLSGFTSLPGQSGCENCLTLPGEYTLEKCPLPCESYEGGVVYDVECAYYFYRTICFDPTGPPPCLDGILTLHIYLIITTPSMPFVNWFGISVGIHADWGREVLPGIKNNTSWIYRKAKPDGWPADCRIAFNDPGATFATLPLTETHHTPAWPTWNIPECYDPEVNDLRLACRIAAPELIRVWPED